MVYLKNILVTTDLSRYSLAGMEHAASFGLLYASKIFLLHVVDSPKAVDAAEEAMAEFVERNLSPDLKLAQVVRPGSPAELHMEGRDSSISSWVASRKRLFGSQRSRF
jgi:nucleotide-binding universal stress UspA family protein